MRTNLSVLLICFFGCLSVALLFPVPSSRLRQSHGVSEDASGIESWPRGVASEHDAISKDRLFQKYVRAPLSFEANYGQTDSQVKFVSRGAGYSLFLTTTEAVIALGKTATRSSSAAESISRTRELQTSTELPLSTDDPSVLRMRLSGANAAPKVIGQNEHSAKANYFIGKVANAWRTNVPTYAAVKYKDVYAGIDLVYYGNQQELEYDFIVNPSASPASIRIVFAGMSNLELDKHGDLVISTSGHSLKQFKPVIYQQRNGETQRVEGGYVLIDDHSIGFQVGEYDPTAPLIIDPVLSYSTYLGGTNQDIGWGIAVDPSGYIYATGYTSSIDFPTSNAVQPVYRGPFPQEDVFVTKLTPDGSALVYSTYLGGSRSDEAFSVAVDSAGNAHIVGLTLSSDFPTSSALQPNYQGGEDGFVAKLNPTGSQLVFSTYLGGSSTGAGGLGHDRVLDVDVDDNSGEICVTGFTLSSDFPVANALQPASGSYSLFGATFYTDAFVTKLNATGTAFIYSTYLGANSTSQGLAIALDQAGNAYIAGLTTSTNFPTVNAFQAINRGGEDAFVTKLNPSGSSILYSSYFGGSRGDNAGGVGLDRSGNVYITGTTESANLSVANATQPTIGGSFDAYVAKLNPNSSGSSSLLFATYLGGTRSEFVNGGIADRDGNFYVAGNTTSSDFPTVSPFQSVFRGGGNDVFVAKLRPDGTTVYSSYLGGSGNDVAIHIAADSAGNAYVTGSTDSINFPTVLAFKSVKDCCSHDSFITKIADPPPNQSPTAVCKNLTKNASTSCQANIEPNELNDGSFDPDGDSLTFSIAQAGPYSVGSTPVTLIVTDSHGSISSCSSTVTVIDDTAPTIIAPPALTVFTDNNGSCGATVSDSQLGVPTTVDNCSVTVSRSGVPANNLFPVGSTVVTYQASDPSGNVATATQFVSVIDKTAPVPNTQILPTVTGECAVLLTPPTATDNCAGTVVGTTNDPTSYNAPGSYIVHWTYNDGHGNVSIQNQMVIVRDETAPTVTAPPNIIVNTGTAATSCGVMIMDAILGVANASDNCGSVTISRTGVPSGNVFPVGVTTVNYIGTDQAGNVAQATQTVTVIDTTPPAITGSSNITVVADPGACSAVVNYNLSATDNCSGVTLTVNFPSGSVFPIGTTMVHAIVTDAAGNTSNQSFSVTVTNPDPVVTITEPASGAIFAINTPVMFRGTYTDAGGGTHNAAWKFDSITEQGTNTEPNGSSPGTVTATHSFASAGVYLITLIVNDSCGGIGTTDVVDGLTAMAVIYDPNGGFVTGHGWIDSPIGAYIADSSIAGRANFGFFSKYQKGATVPTGQTEFRFRVADLNFHSTAYEWLVVAGARAQFKGSGTINGSGNFGFMLTAIDGDLNGGDPDKFRIKIWDKNNGNVVIYDNQLAALDNSDPTTVLQAGSILIQK